MEQRIKIAKGVFQIESEAISNLESRINDSFHKAIDLIMAKKGKVVVSGIGKSGIIGKKLSATLSSTGTPSLFLHPSEASHGDLGVISKDDVVIAISYGGGSGELNSLYSYTKRKGVSLIGITGNLKSKMAEMSDCVLDVSVSKEACPLNLAPTASSTATLAMCDALAMVLLDEKGFKEEDFAQVHPGGSLGRKLLTRVKDLIKTDLDFPMVKEESSLQEVVGVMTSKDVRGVCGVLNSEGLLAGVITDGDVRRWLGVFFDGDQKPSKAQAKDIMNSNPKFIDSSELAGKALYLMEQFSISSLFVMSSEEKNSAPIGILHIQDLLDAKIT